MITNDFIPQIYSWIILYTVTGEDQFPPIISSKFVINNDDLKIYAKKF